MGKVKAGKASVCAEEEEGEIEEEEEEEEVSVELDEDEGEVDESSWVMRERARFFAGPS